MQLGKLSSDFCLRTKKDFNSFWKKLNSRDIRNVRHQIDVLQFKGTPDKKIISNLQNRGKLSERYEAERAFRTESKVLESQSIKEVAEEKNISKFKIIPEQGACQQCLDYTRSGRRIFNQGALQKDGRDIPPIHPQCRCTLVVSNN